MSRIHHVWFRRDHGRALFADEEDRRAFLRLLARIAAERRWRCLSYCLLDTHFHLVVETLGPTLRAGLRELTARYDGRSGAKRIRTDAQLAQVLRYVARNPVAAGLCAAPGAWPWSSHAALLANRADQLVAAERVDELLAVWGGAPGTRYAGLFAP